MRVVRLLGLRRNARVGNSQVIEVQRARVGREQESLRGESMNDGRCINGANQETAVSYTKLQMYTVAIVTYPFFSGGIAILFSTCPVSVLAALTSPSVPDEYSAWPSVPKPKQRQLPLWRLVRHMVSMWPLPLRADELDAASSSPSPSSLGSRNV